MITPHGPAAACYRCAEPAHRWIDGRLPICQTCDETQPLRGLPVDSLRCPDCGKPMIILTGGAS